MQRIRVYLLQRMWCKEWRGRWAMMCVQALHTTENRMQWNAQGAMQVEGDLCHAATSLISSVRRSFSSPFVTFSRLTVCSSTSLPPTIILHLLLSAAAHAVV